MAFTIDKCDNFDGLKCTKCGRMMPDLCKDQQALEEKAKKYDLYVAANEVGRESSPVDETLVCLANEESEQPEAPTPVAVTKRPVPKTVKGAPKK